LRNALTLLSIPMDVKVPLADDDREMENGWRMIPVAPTADDIWIMVDDKPDGKTGWARRDRLAGLCGGRCWHARRHGLLIVAKCA
jgi:hypothetical protein